jgi:hypothetical protein
MTGASAGLAAASWTAVRIRMGTRMKVNSLK